MAALTQTYTPVLTHIAFLEKRDKFIEKLIPRRCMVVSVGLILAGMSIPMLMVVQLIPINFILGFAGFALVEAGSVMALFFYGEI
jgi:hypothetical protein